MTSRACAAFFRRYVHSKKRVILCVCKNNSTKSVHPCRHCRMVKCLKAGLQRNSESPIAVQLLWSQKSPEVQPLREPNCPSMPVEEGALVPSISVRNQIISRGCSKIQETAVKWGDYNAKRKILYGEDPDRLNFYEISCLTKMDAMIMWQMTEELFPCVKSLKTHDMVSSKPRQYHCWALGSYALQLHVQIFRDGMCERGAGGQPNTARIRKVQREEQGSTVQLL